MSVGYQCDRRGAFEEGASQGRDVFDVDDDWFIWVDVARKKDSKKGLDLCYGCWEAMLSKLVSHLRDEVLSPALTDHEGRE